MEGNLYAGILQTLLAKHPHICPSPCKIPKSQGIYDVAAFERSLAGQVRQNTLLSHDLFEGIHGRAALVTNIILYEEYPSRYLVYAHRMRRWIRGDWQLLP